MRDILVLCPYDSIMIRGDIPRVCGEKRGQVTTTRASFLGVCLGGFFSKKVGTMEVGTQRQMDR